MKSSVKDLIEYLKTIPNPDTTEVEICLVEDKSWSSVTIVDLDLSNDKHYEHIEYSEPIYGVTGTLTLGNN